MKRYGMKKRSMVLAVIMLTAFVSRAFVTTSICAEADTEQEYAITPGIEEGSKTTTVDTENESRGFNNYEVDVDAIKVLAEKDMLHLKVTQKAVTDGLYQNSACPDALTFTIKNTNNSVVITEITFLVVAYQEQVNGKKYAAPIEGLSDGEYEYSTLWYRRTLHTLKSEGLNLKGGEVTQVVFPCNHSLFSGAQVLVASYKSDAGYENKNWLLDEWQELALGSPTHILE